MEPAITGKAILVVDDEPDVTQILKDLLGSESHRVESAPNGVVALRMLQERGFDLILSDIRMPELDGPGLYREVARRHPELRQRFVFLTGDLLSPETLEFLEEARVPYLHKPFDLTEVRGVVQRALRAH